MVPTVPFPSRYWYSHPSAGILGGRILIGLPKYLSAFKCDCQSILPMSISTSLPWLDSCAQVGRPRTKLRIATMVFRILEAPSIFQRTPPISLEKQVVHFRWGVHRILRHIAAARRCRFCPIAEQTTTVSFFLLVRRIQNRLGAPGAWVFRAAALPRPGWSRRRRAR